MTTSSRFVQLTGNKEQPAVPVTVESIGDDRYRVTVGEQTLELDAFVVDGRLALRHGERSYDLSVEKRGDTLFVPGSNGRVAVKLQDARLYEMLSVLGQAGGGLRPELISPMAGKVVLVRVSDGEEVGEGQALVIIEAMKMENELRAPAPVRVKEVKVVAGQVVSPGDVLMTFDI
jgi:biotin carboxyl carrier protein